MTMNVWFRASRDAATGYNKLERCVSDNGRTTFYVIRWYDRNDYPKAARAAFENNSHLEYARNLTRQPGG